MGGEKLKKILFACQSYTLVSLFRLVLAAGLCLFPSLLAAQEAPPPVSPEEALILGEESPALPVVSQGPVSFFTILRTIVVLLLAAGAIYGLVYFLKRIARPRELRDPNLRILATAHLGQNRFIHAVILGTRVWLVGSSDGGLTRIADIEEQEAIDALLLEESRRNAGALPGRFPDFRALLRRFSPSSGEGTSFEGPSAADNIRKRQDRLKGL
ncbi:MAG: flagellar biosynthetic protein FliO [Treponema sp.]|nr:flagellar biosynthetic protein FliO [Treponema sp.]